MSKKLETVMIAGVEFTIKSKTVEEPHYNTSRWNRLKTLSECYNNPSSAKISINEFWTQWAWRVNPSLSKSGISNVLEFGIRSYNCNFFSYGGILLFNGKRYVIDITATHNYLWKIAE